MNIWKMAKKGGREKNHKYEAYIMFFGWDQDQCAPDSGMIVPYPGVRLENLF